MSTIVVVGAQWGDEGKGKVVDCLSARADMVVRFNGGANAGHTIVVAQEEYVLHLVPSGAVREGAACVIGNGCVVDAGLLLDEYDDLRRRGIDLTGRLFISGFAHLVLPHHKAADGALEDSSSAPIGTTRRGIGPAYCDKYARYGVRVEDLLDDRDLRAKLEAAYAYRARWTGSGDYPPLEEVYARLAVEGKRLAPFIVDTSLLINGYIADGKSVLFEGAQGSLLDVDFGTYPFVTSSNPVAPYAAIGSGVGLDQLDYALGVVKAYLTRVGEGPFPTELTDSTGDYLRERGYEYGRSTGRPRRCGWLDLVPLRLAARVNGLHGAVVSKLDVLDELEEIPVCTAYKLRGKIFTEMPLPVALMAEAEPVYETLPGWKTDTSGITSWDDLPKKAQAYLRFIEEGCGVPVVAISVGQRRDQIIWLEEVF
jgi:adenylosuccinate synthase